MKRWQLLSQRLLTRAAAAVSDCRLRWLKNALIKWAVRHYAVDLSAITAESIADYPSFNAFFTRALKPSARPLCPDPHTVVAPADGLITDLGVIASQHPLVAKKKRYSCAQLLDDARLSATFEGGHYITFYLSPADYHRVHMPLAGRLLESRYVAGSLFSVHPATVAAMPTVLAENERLIARFDTAIGEMVVVFVGALLVAGIETVWQHNLSQSESAPSRFFPAVPVTFSRGDEIGRFRFGSSVVALFPRNSVKLTAANGERILMGQSFGRVTSAPPAPKTGAKKHDRGRQR